MKLCNCSAYCQPRVSAAYHVERKLRRLQCQPFTAATSGESGSTSTNTSPLRRVEHTLSKRLCTPFHPCRAASRSGDDSSSGNSSDIGSHGNSQQSEAAATSAVDPIPRWLAILLLPSILWCIIWSCTAGMVAIADLALAGMSSMAQVLYPVLPVPGLSSEDIAASLVQTIQSSRDSAAVWTSPGLLAPAWMLRVLMIALYALASTSSSIATAALSLPHLPALLTSCSVLMYGTCLVLMLPVGAGLNNLAVQAVRRRHVSIPKLNDDSLLALKLVGLLAWPGISASAVLQAPIAAASAAAGTAAVLAALALQAGVGCLVVLLLLAAAAAAAEFGWQIVRGQAASDVVVKFGCHLGGVCSFQGMLNVVLLCLGQINRSLHASELVMSLVSTLILGRIAWSIEHLRRHGVEESSVWLQLLSLNPVRS